MQWQPMDERRENKDGDNTEILSKELGTIPFRDPIYQILLLAAMLLQL